jgi:hypothetical protein
MMWVHGNSLRKMENELRILRTLLPICAWCMRIRDDETGWVELERYVTKRTSTSLTDGVCPECLNKVMTDLE